jgi:hypothetical protein
MSMQDKEKKYLRGHVIDGRNLFPAMAYLVSCRVQCLMHVVMGLPCIDVTVFIFTSHIKVGVTTVTTFELSCWTIRITEYVALDGRINEESGRIW